jgi:tRNA nucleotidyltransferase (CCA-adding enzyme)
MSSPIRASIPRDVLDLCAEFHAKGARVWIVGGGVRDLLVGKSAVDFDLATSATPDRVVAMFKRTIPTGIAHGTVTVLYRKQSYEVTTLRGDVGYADGRRPDRVEYVTDITADLARRDFTVNAIAYDPENDALLDPFGGLEDIRRRLLRAVGDPLARFREDGLRILRGARFTSTLEFDLDSETEAAFGPSLDVYARVSRERIRDEWIKAFKSERPSRAFEVMARTGILGATSEPLGRFARDRPERFAAMLRAMDACPPVPDLRLSALLAESVPASDAHGSTADASARFAGELVHELRGSREERTRIPRWIQGAGALPPAADAVAVRRFVQHTGRDDLEPTLTLAEALALGDEDPSRLAAVRALASAARAQLDAGMVVDVKELAVKGSDIIRALGTPPGKHIGVLLSLLLDEVTLEPSKNQTETLLRLARDLEPRARALEPR